LPREVWVATVRFVTVLRVTAGCVTLALAVIGCADGGDDAASTTTVAERTTTSTTVPERAASTTTTAYDPAAVEGQVEAAYLRSWDVYADAVYHLRLDEASLKEVYADPLLGVLVTELEERARDGRAAFVRVDHDYTIEVTGPEMAIVVDRYVNHQVLIDPATKRPTEDDPNSVIVEAFTLRLADGTWRVVDQQRLR
jgi:hypothetical protein